MRLTKYFLYFNKTIHLVLVIFYFVKYTSTSSSDIEDDYKDYYDIVQVPLWDNFTSLFPTPKTPIEDDDFDYGEIREWKIKDTLQGYEIASDGLQFRTKLDPEMKLIIIRIDVGKAWTLLEKRPHRRNLQLRIATWNSTNRVNIKVPYGVMPQELVCVERPTFMDVQAPYGFIEHKKPKKT